MKKETDLYPAVKALLQGHGYDVMSEVKDIDVLATDGDHTICVEMKTDLNLKLITQATKRQSIADDVYVAIPKPTYRVMGSQVFKDKIFLLRRLGIGVIFVTGDNAYTEHPPIALDLERSKASSKRKRKNLMTEKKGRSGDHNLGGTKGKITTAYKELCIHMAYLMEKSGPMKVRDLREAVGEKAQSVLAKNYYGWFERSSRGVYEITEKGKEELKKYKNITDRL